MSCDVPEPSKAKKYRDPFMTESGEGRLTPLAGLTLGSCFVPAAVPSDTQISVLVPSLARKASSPPKSTKEPGFESSVSDSGLTFWIMCVPATVPSLIQGSTPVTESKDLKKKWPPSSSGRSLPTIRGLSRRGVRVFVCGAYENRRLVMLPVLLKV